MGVVAVIITHDPELDRFKLVLDRASEQVDSVIVVDNDSKSKGVLRGLCECGVKVRMYTLSSLIKEFNIEDGSILKMDCEGCEYETIPRASSKDLSVFSQIVIEHHNGYHELRNALEKAGFKAVIKPIRSVEIPIERQGYIIAKREN